MLIRMKIIQSNALIHQVKRCFHAKFSGWKQLFVLSYDEHAIYWQIAFVSMVTWGKCIKSDVFKCMQVSVTRTLNRIRCALFLALLLPLRISWARNQVIKQTPRAFPFLFSAQRGPARTLTDLHVSHVSHRHFLFLHFALIIACIHCLHHLSSLFLYLSLCFLS